MNLDAYTLVFRPLPQIYPGPSGAELISGKHYSDWVVNDHCHICDEVGRWHLFGITHPLTTAKNIHEGELQLFHAVADSPLGPYRDLGTVLPPSARLGELPEIHSPAIIRTNEAYYMIYGPHHFRMAKSDNLTDWETLGTVFEEIKQDARDPQILFYEGVYLLSYCMGNDVYYRTSTDLFTWSERILLLALKPGISPESPFLCVRDGQFYLFVCLWDGKWDQQTVSQAYQGVTQVYKVPELRQFYEADLIAEIAAHAPELLEYDGQYWLTSAEYPQRGVNIARLTF